MDKCILVFFDDEYQKQLKERALNNNGFEYTLRNYQDLFLKEIIKVETINAYPNCDYCSDCFIYNSISAKFESYVKDFCDDIRTKAETIRTLFDEIIDIYITALSINRSVAVKKLNAYILNRCHGFKAQAPVLFSMPLFRARTTGDYDGSNIHELFHVPFNKRQLIGNQRFSLTGVPLLYLAESLPLALKEINCKNTNYNAAVFLPKYSYNYNDSLFDMTNSFIDSINSIQGLLDAGCDFSYKGEFDYAYTECNIDSFLARFILLQCLHFAAQGKEKYYFTPEYLLPQLLMDVISEKGWIGIRYQSSKNSINESRDSFLHYVDNNICFYVPYASTNYNEILLEKFYYATWCKGEELRYYSELNSKILEFEKIKDDAKNKGYLINDYIICLEHVERHVERMIETIGREAYQKRKACRVEITLLYKLIEQILPVLREPEKHGIKKLNDKIVADV